jgi:uridine kinase
MPSSVAFSVPTPHPQPRPIPLDQARRAVHALARGRAHAVDAITGPVGSGKSHLAKLLSSSILSTDDYLPDYDKVAYEDRDDPRLADHPRLVADLASLRRSKITRVPSWSFQTHSRIGEREISPPATGLIVVEGIHALHDTLLPHIDIAVFVEAASAVRWQRWEHLEATGQRGWGVEVARAFFHGVAEPTFARFEETYRARAHLIVTNHHGVPS